MTPPATRLALFGTSADPPTRGHRALLEGLLGLFPQVVTWASDNPLKQHGAPLELRTALLAALVGAIDDPRLSLEPELSSPWAVETLERARARWPQRDLGASLDLLPLAIPPSASSRIRERPDPAQVPSELWPVLLQHNLYGLSQP